MFYCKPRLVCRKDENGCHFFQPCWLNMERNPTMLHHLTEPWFGQPDTGSGPKQSLPSACTLVSPHSTPCLSPEEWTPLRTQYHFFISRRHKTVYVLQSTQCHGYRVRSCFFAAAMHAIVHSEASIKGRAGAGFRRVLFVQ